MMSVGRADPSTTIHASKFGMVRTAELTVRQRHHWRAFAPQLTRDKLSGRLRLAARPALEEWEFRSQSCGLSCAALPPLNSPPIRDLNGY